MPPNDMSASDTSCNEMYPEDTPSNDMSPYQEALSVLKHLSAFGIEPSLEGVTVLMRWLGNPQLNYPCIQIAGTNGKSSTARFTAAFLYSQGKKVGLYTSPELIEYPERLEIDGVVVSQGCFATAVLSAYGAAQEAVAAGEIWGITEFELLTAAALWLFADEHVDFAVLEVGLGGRWDATSVVDPQVAVITGVGLDHMAILGDTVEEIAAEKAAIIKPGCVPVLGTGTLETRGIFLARCEEVGVTAPLIADYEGQSAGLGLSSPKRFPSYQKQNIACALAATRAALGENPDATAIRQVFETLTIPGRFELLRDQPPLLIDATHNPQSAQVLAQALIETQGLDKATGHIKGFDTLLLGVLSDKDAEGIIKELAPLFDRLMVTESASPRAIPAAELANKVEHATGHKPEVAGSVSLALDELTRRDAAVVATGSITLVGDIKRLACQRDVCQNSTAPLTQLAQGKTDLLTASYTSKAAHLLE